MERILSMICYKKVMEKCEIKDYYIPGLETPNRWKIMTGPMLFSCCIAFLVQNSMFPGVNLGRWLRIWTFCFNRTLSFGAKFDLKFGDLLHMCVMMQKMAQLTPIIRQTSVLIPKINVLFICKAILAAKFELIFFFNVDATFYIKFLQNCCIVKPTKIYILGGKIWVKCVGSGQYKNLKSKAYLFDPSSPFNK